MKEFKPRDKLTQRMTRDGAVLDNQTTGAEIHISERDAEKQLSPDRQPVQMGKRDAPMNPAEDAPKHGRQLRPQEQKEPEKEQPKPQQPSAEPFQPQGGSPVSNIPQDIPTSAAPGGTAEKFFDRAAAEHDAHKARQTARMSRDAAQQRYSASRLQFSEEERAAPELHKHIHRAEKAADKLDAAQAAIPKKRVLRKERVFDEASGTAKAKLRFDTVDKSPPKLKPNPLGRPLREVAVQAHGKIHEVEHENVGVESGHKAEELAEHGAGGAIRWERRHRKLKPYRAAEKAEHKAVNANAEYHYQKVLHDNPEMLSGNPLNRFFQKQRLKREYAKAARTAKAAGSTAQATAKGAEKTAEATATAAKKAAEKAKEAAEFVARHWKGVLVVLAGFLLIVMLIGGLQSCSALVGAAGGGVAASSYQSEDADILAAEAAYCTLEAELQEYLDTYERTHDYDEYHYDLDEIKHDPYVLASILSALHDGAWTASEVQGTLQMLFEKQYILTETVVTEVRYRTVTRTDSEGNEYEVEVPYNYYICTVELENFDLSHIPVYITVETRNGHTLYIVIDYDKLLDEEEERYQTYFLNPVDEADLMALLEDDSQNTPVVCSCTEKCTAGKVNTNCAICKTDMTNCAGKEATPDETEQPDEPTPEKKNNMGGILILVLFLAAGGGGALWYFKLRKPKSSIKGGDELDEFDFGEDDEAEEYGDYEDADSASDPDEQENEE